MTSLTHAIVGVAIAARFSNPYLAAPTALAFHFVCDLIPHWDLGTNYRKRPKIITGSLAILETCVALFIGLIVAWPLIENKTVLIVAVIFSLLPDWLEAPYHILNPHAPRWLYWIYKPQSIFHTRAQLPWGLVTQIITVVLAIGVGFFW